jgi:hypothetical protein
MAKPATSGLTYAALRKECLNSVRQWPGCESLAGIQIVRERHGGFSVRVTLYGNSKRQLADRAIQAVQREARRNFYLID